MRVAHRSAVALVGVDRHDPDPSQPLRWHVGHPRPQVLGVTAVEHVQDLPRGDIDDSGDEPSPTTPVR
jgi:hypothetical protein